MRIHNPTITGSFTISGSNLNIDPSGNITTLGSLTAAEYVVSSSVTALTITTASGSVAFGDTQDDTHQFTGSLSVSGSLTSEGLTSKGTAPHITFEETDQSGINHKLSMQVNGRSLSWNSVGDG